ncbi:hypothetical protein BC833DRAFT_646334 [Globomyces pollinis-pini]|nr:hypothetical protein BC833DRAFT_646334 [Globomyces pollinis-pini]
MFITRILRNTYNTSELEIIKAFKASFNKACIRSEDLNITYSRSSGPGGQNVNKINSKVDIKFPIAKVQWLPAVIKTELRKKFPNKVNRRDEYMVNSDQFRTQKQNFEDCLTKLYQDINEVAVVPGETSEATKERVKALKAAEQSRKLKMKTKRSDVKASRRKDY